MFVGPAAQLHQPNPRSVYVDGRIPVVPQLAPEVGSDLSNGWQLQYGPIPSPLGGDFAHLHENLRSTSRDIEKLESQIAPSMLGLSDVFGRLAQQRALNMNQEPAHFGSIGYPSPNLDSMSMEFVPPPPGLGMMMSPVMGG